MDIVWTIFWGLVGISLLVTIHEFGHFWVARRLGFKVLRFSVGFGKPLFKRIGRDPDRIEYVIAAIPLGGYVRMLDEREGEVPEADRARAFTSKPPWQRILVLLAGPAANILFAIVVLWIMFWVRGVEQLKPVVGDVAVGKPAAEAGLRPRDVILAVNGAPIEDLRELQFKLLGAISSDGPVVLRVRSERGAEREVTLPLADSEQRYDLTRPNKLLPGLGFEFWMPPIAPRVTGVIEGGPADIAGMKPGDLIVSADGTAMAEWRFVARYIRERPGREIQLVVRRDGQDIPLRVTPLAEQQGGREIGLLRISGPDPDRLLDYFPDEYVTRTSLGPLASLAAGASQAWEMTTAQATFFWRMLTNRISRDNLTSLITIADYAGQTASAGPASYLTLLVLLSLSLGFMNLLPIPLLDGGQIVFQVAEWVRGRPLSERVQIVGQQAGIVAIVLLMGLALFNDLSTYVFSAFSGAGK
jgi:regulator of sigma E protease